VQFSWSPCDSEFPMTGSRCLYDHLLSERYEHRWIRWMHLAMWHSQANDDRSVKDFGQRVLNRFESLQQTDLHEEPFVILTTVWWRLYCVFAILVISSCTLAGSHTSQRQKDEPPRVFDALLLACWRWFFCETEVVCLVDWCCCSDERAAANWRSVYAANSCAYWYRLLSGERDIWEEVGRVEK